ncbi:MAG TPA: hypothetical protein VG938_01660 [Verrucomicrobiae bacterium]|jgi:hypothetical protein|nr:hypothetical protein [Verrucomicrobiae bacterium]
MKMQAKFWSALAVALFGAGICLGQASFSSQSVADAFVTSGGSLSSSNFGGAGALSLSASGLPQGEFQSVLKFSLAGAENSFNAQFGVGQWTVQSVTLELTSSPHGNSIFNNIAAGRFNVSLMQNNSWVEGTGTGGTPTSDGISFDSLLGVYINNAADQGLGTFSFPGGSSGQNAYTLALSSGLVSDVMSGDDASLRLFAADSTVSYLFSSRSGGAPAAQPTIVVEATAVPEPGSVLLCAAALIMFLLLQSVRRWIRRQR